MVQKSYITKKLKENIEMESEQWARNYIAAAYHSQFETPESKKEVEAAKKNMSDIEQRILWMQNYLKTMK